MSAAMPAGPSTPQKSSAAPSSSATPSSSAAASEAAPSEADANGRIAGALARMRRAFEARPEAAITDDSAATASLQTGARMRIAADDGHAVVSDMPAPAGDGGGPTPAWYFRAGLAACTATALRLYAAERGIVLDALEVRVTSRSDKRGLLRIGDISAALDLCVEVRLSAAGVPDEVLHDLAREAYRFSPTNATLLAGRLGELRVSIQR